MKRAMHGQWGTGAYKSWDAMLTRCYNKNVPEYVNYGGRGITVCERWHSFVEFFADMGQREKGWTLERIDTNGNYEPSNCKWVPKGEQSSNTRANRRVTAFGETKLVSEWSVDPRCVVDRRSVYKRLDRGWPVEAAITTPPYQRLN